MKQKFLERKRGKETTRNRDRERQENVHDCMLSHYS